MKTKLCFEHELDSTILEQFEQRDLLHFETVPDLTVLFNREWTNMSCKFKGLLYANTG